MARDGQWVSLADLRMQFPRGRDKPIPPCMGGSSGPAGGAPKWLQVLMMIVNRTIALPVADGVGVRAVVASPTLEHVAAALAVSGVAVPDAPLPTPVLAVGTPVATALSGELRDVVVSGLDEQRLNLAGTQLRLGGPQPPMMVLPDGWVARPAMALPEVAGWAAHVLFDGRVSQPGWAYQELCREPVVVLAQQPAAFLSWCADLAECGDWWNPLQQLGLAGAQEGVKGWFRGPVVVVSPQALSECEWLSALPARLVVALGFRCWMSPARRVWGSVPQVLLLDRRSQTDVSEFRSWYDGTAFASIPSGLLVNRRTHGLDFTVFGEPLHGGSLEELEWEMEWGL